MSFNPESNFFSKNKKEESPESNIEKKEQEEIPHLDSVLVFGIRGEEINDYKKIPKEKKEEFLNKIEDLKDNEEKRKWVNQTRKMMNVPAKMRAIAALELLKEGDIDEMIISGGKTMGEDLPSEAELMRDYIAHKSQTELNRKTKKEELTLEEAKKELQKRLNKIKLEDKATNTIENLANVINMMDSADKKYRDLSLLSNDFHVERIKMLTEKFEEKGTKEPANQQLKERSSHYNKFLEKTCSIKNEEYKKMLESEERWKRGVKEMPLYFLPQAVYVNKERLDQMYESNKKEIDKSLQEKGLTWKEFLDLPEEERLKLRDVPPEEWAKKINTKENE